MKKTIYILLSIMLLLPCFITHADEEPDKIDENKKEWKAIIAYFPGSPEEATEDWIFFLFDIEEHFFEDENIYCIGIFAADDRNVPIGRGDTSVANIDISEFAGETAGYIFVMNDKDPVWCDYMPSAMVIEQAEAYFNDVESF